MQVISFELGLTEPVPKGIKYAQEILCIQKPYFHLLNQNYVGFYAGTYPSFPDAAILFIIRTTYPFSGISLQYCDSHTQKHNHDDNQFLNNTSFINIYLQMDFASTFAVVIWEILRKLQFLDFLFLLSEKCNNNEFHSEAVAQRLHVCHTVVWLLTIFFTNAI